MFVVEAAAFSFLMDVKDRWTFALEIRKQKKKKKLFRHFILKFADDKSLKLTSKVNGYKFFVTCCQI